MSRIEKSKEDWDNIVKEFKSYKGKVAEFCKERGITRNSLYYQRKIREKANENVATKQEISFTKIDMSEPERKDKPESSSDTKQNKIVDNINLENKKHTIKIEIGKAKIILDSTDKKGISLIVKEINSVC
jgi:hypothetical protein